MHKAAKQLKCVCEPSLSVPKSSKVFQYAPIYFSNTQEYLNDNVMPCT